MNMAKKSRFVETDKGKARVNWYRNGRLGVTYLEIESELPESDILMDTEVEFEYGDIEPDQTKNDVRNMDYDDLKAFIKEIRRVREED